MKKPNLFPAYLFLAAISLLSFFLGFLFGGFVFFSDLSLALSSSI